MQLENSMLMYSVYNVETLEKLITTVHNIHNTTSSHERLFVGQNSPSIFKTLYVHSLGLNQYSINLLLYLRTMQDKYRICISNQHFGERVSTKYFDNTSKIERHFK